MRGAGQSIRRETGCVGSVACFNHGLVTVCDQDTGYEAGSKTVTWMRAVFSAAVTVIRDSCRRQALQAEPGGPEAIVDDRHGAPRMAVTKHASPIGEASKTSGVDARARRGEAGYAGQGHEQQTEPDRSRRPLVSDAVPASMIERRDSAVT